MRHTLNNMYLCFIIKVLKSSRLYFCHQITTIDILHKTLVPNGIVQVEYYQVYLKTLV